MNKCALIVVATLLPGAVYAQTVATKKPLHNPASVSETPSMPAEAEINALIDKASEYVETYRRTFANSKASLDQAATRGFDQSANTLADQASDVITAIKKNGSTAVALVSLLTILDDMSLNAQKASAQVMLVAAHEYPTSRHGNATQDFQDLAQAGKNCYDISELLFHCTIRYILAEEAALRTLLVRDTKR